MHELISSRQTLQINERREDLRRDAVESFESLRNTLNNEVKNNMIASDCEADILCNISSTLSTEKYLEAEAIDGMINKQVQRKQQNYLSWVENVGDVVTDTIEAEMFNTPIKDGFMTPTNRTDSLLQGYRAGAPMKAFSSARHDGPRTATSRKLLFDESEWSMTESEDCKVSSTHRDATDKFSTGDKITCSKMKRISENNNIISVSAGKKKSSIVNSSCRNLRLVLDDPLKLGGNNAALDKKLDVTFSALLNMPCKKNSVSRLVRR